MFRVLPLLVFALLPVAVGAAPVPPGGRVEFGRNGLLTRADLEKVKFDSRPIKDADEDAKAGPAKFETAVHMPWTKFRAGEPIPVYFVLRNRSAKDECFDVGMELFGRYPANWGGCQINVCDRATGEQVRAFGKTCSFGWNMDLPAGGFYCMKGDLASIRDKRLPPGEYEVGWRFAGLRAVSVPFTVTKVDGAKPNASAKREVQFYHIAPQVRAADEPGKAGEPFIWRECHLNHIPGGAMAAALAVGPQGVFVPDIYTVPAADKLIEASVEWKPYREGDRVVVTLRSVVPNKQVRFAEVPQLFLQIETNERAGRWWEEKPADEKEFARDSARLVTPLVIEARLPQNWRAGVGAEAGRVAVLVTAKPIELPTPHHVVRAKKAVELVALQRDNGPLWSGIVRTDFTELLFRPALIVQDR